MKMHITLLLAITVLLGEMRAEEAHRSYKVQVFGGTGQVEVVAKTYVRKVGVSSREQLGVLGPDSEKMRNEILRAKSLQIQGPFKMIPGIPQGESQAVSKITPATNRKGTPYLAEKLCLLYRGQSIGVIPGNPLCDLPLSGLDHGHRGPTLSKAIVISDQHLLLVVDQTGGGGTALDKVYSATKGEEGNWSITELAIEPLGDIDRLEEESNPANKAQK